MTAADLSLPALVTIALAIVALGLVAARMVSGRTGWRPAGGLALIAASPLVPHVPVAFGFSLDDILPIVGILTLLAAVDIRSLIRIPTPWLLVGGLTLAVGAGIVASLANGSDPTGVVSMLLRSPGRYLFLAVIVVLAVLAEPHVRRRRLVAQVMALLGSFEAIFGLAAFFLPLGGIGLEPTRKFSVLYFEVPGRIAGTLGISPNFLGAIFVLTILLTAGLAIAETRRRAQILLWASVTLQFLALTLTFTRASLGLALVGIVILVLIRGRIRVLAPIGLAIAVGFAITPALERLTADVPDRLALWTSATRMMLDHPWTGVGPGRTILVARQDPERYVETPFGTAESNAHNTVLLAGAETGLLGALGVLLINLGLALGAARVLIRARSAEACAIDTAAAIAVLAYLAQGMVNNLFSVAVTGVVFALVAGSYVVCRTPDASVGDQRQRAPTGPPFDPIA